MTRLRPFPIIAIYVIAALAWFGLGSSASASATGILLVTTCLGLASRRRFAISHVGWVQGAAANRTPEARS